MSGREDEDGKRALALFVAKYVAAQDEDWKGCLDGAELIDKAIDELIASADMGPRRPAN